MSDLEARVAKVEARVDGHLDSCSVRYEGIKEMFALVEKRLDNLSSSWSTFTRLMLLGAMGLIGSLIAYIWQAGI